MIATGSNNSSRYFEYYFGKYPSIIRKNRNSIAIIDGNETEKELEALGTDIFSYFGLGCRNVSKIYVPEDMTLELCEELGFIFRVVSTIQNMPTTTIITRLFTWLIKKIF